MTANADHNIRIEALRGLAALTVAAFHAGQTTAGGQPGAAMLAFGGDDGSFASSIMSAIYGLFLNGIGAVVLFFVISGHVLRLSLDRSRQTGGRLAATFLLRRAVRLLPPVAFMVLIFAAAFAVEGRKMSGFPDAYYTPLNLVLNAFLTSESLINGVVWSLRIEALAAPVILLLWFVRRWLGPGALLAAVLLLCVSSFMPGVDRWAMQELNAPWLFVPLLWAFGAGMLVKEWCLVLAHLPIGKWGGTCIALGCLTVMTGGLLIGGNFRFMTEILGSVAVVAGVSMGYNGLVPRLLDSRLARSYGRISYSFYLLHPLTLTVLWVDRPGVDALLSWGVPALVVAFLAFVATTVAITPLAMLSHALIEAPAIRWSQRLGSPRPVASVTSTV